MRVLRSLQRGSLRAGVDLAVRVVDDAWEGAHLIPAAFCSSTQGTLTLDHSSAARAKLPQRYPKQPPVRPGRETH